MRHHRRFIAIAAGAALLAAEVLTSGATAAPAHHAANSSVKGVLLSLGDVTAAYGSGFKQSMSRPITTKDVSKSTTLPGVKNIRINPSDFVGGYQNLFSRSSITFKKGKLTIKPGVSSVSSAVWVFKNSSTPEVLVRYFLHYKLKMPKGFSFKLTAANLVGDDGVLETSSFKMTKPAMSGGGVGLIFRHGQFLGMVTTSSYGPAPSLSSVVALAKKLDSRL
jgi:hypothetical protein